MIASLGNIIRQTILGVMGVQNMPEPFTPGDFVLFQDEQEERTYTDEELEAEFDKLFGC